MISPYFCSGTWFLEVIQQSDPLPGECCKCPITTPKTPIVRVLRIGRVKGPGTGNDRRILYRVLIVGERVKFLRVVIIP